MRTALALSLLFACTAAEEPNPEGACCALLPDREAVAVCVADEVAELEPGVCGVYICYENGQLERFNFCR